MKDDIMWKTSVGIAAAVVLAGCASATPKYDARFGDAVRNAKQATIVNPSAGANPDPVAGLDGKAARDAVLLYQGSFKAPPPAVNVINIGGTIGK
jgi:hypothetical protein